MSIITREVPTKRATSKGDRPPVIASVNPPNMTVDMTPAQVKWWIDLAKEQGVIKNDLAPEKLLFQP